MGGLLFPEGDDAQFADAYAQTLTYALLLARFEGADSLRPAFAVDALRQDHGLLAEALQLIEAPAALGEIRMPIELIERAITAVDSVQLEHHADHWLYFYEQFLGAYDPKLRNDRGVYYTPVEVVRAQIRLTAELLQTRFDKPMAFADDEVVVLDPAVGTGTYPLAVLEHAAEAVSGYLGPGAVRGKLRELADRLHAFEILVGPYAVAHLRLTQRLRDEGVTDKAARVYLTDTLESPNHPAEFTASLLQATLTEERRRAQEVKRDLRVLVCMGNPPYDREQRDPADDVSKRKGGWVRYGDESSNPQSPILEDFLAPVRQAGSGVHLKNLYNDYVYFWRWALWKVLDSTEDAGIVTFITASSYIRGPAFAGMRRKMREVFDDLWIIDLEGDSLGSRKTENVFAIRTPVAIAIGIRNGRPNTETPADVWKTKLTGSERAKLETLDATGSFDDMNWVKCSADWNAPFYATGTGAYFDWPSVRNLFPWQHSGTQLKRTWPIGPTSDVLKDRWKNLVERRSGAKRSAFRETDARKVSGEYSGLFPEDGRENGKVPPIAKLDISSQLPRIIPYSYRSFDRQWVIADTRVADRIRPELWRAHSSAQTYMVSLLTAVLGNGPAAMATANIPDLHYFRGSFGGKHVIPMWRDEEATQPNVTEGLLAIIGQQYSAIPTPEQLFAYVYGILAQPAYVARFWDELELPPPESPLPKTQTCSTELLITERGCCTCILTVNGSGGWRTPGQFRRARPAASRPCPWMIIP